MIAPEPQDMTWDEIERMRLPDIEMFRSLSSSPSCIVEFVDDDDF